MLINLLPFPENDTTLRPLIDALTYVGALVPPLLGLPLKLFPDLSAHAVIALPEVVTDEASDASNHKLRTAFVTSAVLTCLA
jgi:hypothetical protein